MKRILSILLLAVFGLPLVAPLLAHGADGSGGLPACCRRGGKHQCAMGMGEREGLATDGASLKHVSERCPYCPGTVVVAHGGVLAAPSAWAVSGHLVGHPSGVAQTESKRRISRDRSRRKRGPPNMLSV